MKAYIVCILFVFTLTGTTFAQSNQLDKKLDKAADLAEKNKLKEADKVLVDLLEDNPHFGKGWDYLIAVRYYEYEEAKKSDIDFGNITVTTKDSTGKDIPVEDDSLGQKFMELMHNIKPSKTAYNKYLFTIRKALLFSNDATKASIYTRMLFVDPEVDTNVSHKALKYYNQAEEEFSKKNFGDAARLYQRAVDEQPDFYKARMYLGDSYYSLGKYEEAIRYFKEAVNTFPNLVEPHKYLVDAYLKNKMYTEAYNEAITGASVYPDLIMLQRMEDAAYMNDRKINIEWTPRAVFPNRLINDSIEKSMFVNVEKLEAKGPWIAYQGAKEKIKNNCNEKGIIEKTTSLTNSKYLEVFSWEEMLKNTNDTLFDQAKRMQKDGYLDCYVLVTCFHVDFYDQYNDFVRTNKAKIAEYYNRYTVSQKDYQTK